MPNPQNQKVVQIPPDTGERGRFGAFGGRYAPETLMHPLEELEQAYLQARSDASFQRELDKLLRDYAGRPTPLYLAARLSEQLGGAKIYLKREDLLHTGAHKINNCLGQGLLAKRMGKRRLIAETGAGQHGVATATVAALLGFECTVYMGEQDIARQRLNVFRMKLLGAEVVPVSAGSRTLKEAISETMRDWVTNVEHTYYVLGSVLGPHPYPLMVRDFQTVIGKEARQQILEAEGRLPDLLVACVGGGSNSIGLFHEFLNDAQVAMVGVEGGGRGLQLGEHAARFHGGSPGVLHGTYSYVLQDAMGQISSTHSVSAGLDYAAVGPEHAMLFEAGRVEYSSRSDTEALEACRKLLRLEGILPALEPAHAIAEIIHRAPSAKGKIFLVNLSGRGDKDIEILERELQFEAKTNKASQSMSLSELVKLMEQCQKHTLEILGSGAAGRLAKWQRYESDLKGLVQFIKDRLRSDSRENGRKLELSNRLSLERIVVYHCPGHFNRDDIEWAEATLQGL